MSHTRDHIVYGPNKADIEAVISLIYRQVLSLRLLRSKCKICQVRTAPTHAKGVIVSLRTRVAVIMVTTERIYVKACFNRSQHTDSPGPAREACGRSAQAKESNIYDVLYIEKTEKSELVSINIRA